VPDLVQAAGSALRQWRLEPARITQVSHSENVVFRIETTDRRSYVLRMHRPGYHSYEALVSEQLWTKALLDAGMDVPVCVPTDGGDPYGRVEVAGEERLVGVLEWVDGTTMAALMEAGEDESARIERFSALGALLGDLHTQASGWQPPPRFTRHTLDADGLMGTSPWWGPFWQAAVLNGNQQAAFARLRARIHRILLDLPVGPDQFSLIHADLHPGNVVVNTPRLHVIDFDDAGFGWHAYDIAVALKDYRNDPAFAVYREALIRGYRQRRSIDAETLALVPLFLLIRALASIGWADARPELGHPEYGVRLAREVEETAETVLARYL